VPQVDIYCCKRCCGTDGAAAFSRDRNFNCGSGWVKDVYKIQLLIVKLWSQDKKKFEEENDMKPTKNVESYEMYCIVKMLGAKNIKRFR
jgi:hypothetical protein